MAHGSLMILQCWTDRVNFKGLKRIEKDTKGPELDSVGSNLVRFGGSFGFLRFGRFEVRFLEVRKVQGSVFSSPMM